MGDIAIDKLQWLNTLQAPKELIEATKDVEIESLPNLLKHPLHQLNNRLQEWQKCAQEVTSLNEQLIEINQTLEHASHLAKHYQQQLNDPEGLENLATLLLRAQTWHQLLTESNERLPIDTWQQKKAHLELSQLALKNHLKVTAQNDLVVRYQKLPLIVANLMAYGIYTSRNDTIDKVGNLLTIYHEKLEKRQFDDDALNELSEILPIYQQQKLLIDKINQLQRKMHTDSIERNQIQSKLTTLKSIVEQHPTVYAQEQESFGTVAGGSQYFSQFINQALVKCNLLDKSILSFQSVQRSIREFLLLTKKNEHLLNENKQDREALTRYRRQLEELKSQLSEQGVNKSSTYDMLETIKRRLKEMDPEFDYADDNINILLVNQRLQAIKEIIPNEIRQYEKVIPLLEHLKDEINSFTIIRENHNITATNEELSSGFPWKTPLKMTSEEAESELLRLTSAIRGLESLCVYENELKIAQSQIKENQLSCERLQIELEEKLTHLNQLEEKVNEAHSASHKAFEQVKINIAKQEKKQSGEEQDQYTNDQDDLNSENLWQTYLEPLIINQADGFKKWLFDCCQPTNKQSLAVQEQLQFEQLCRDIYIELKYADSQDNPVLKAYQTMYLEPKGRQKLLNLKPAIPIDIQNQLPPLANKELNDALSQFKELAQQENGKIADILEQTCYQLHYIAWKGELEGIRPETLEALHQQFLNDPRYQCLQESRNYESILDWLVGIFQAIKQLCTRPKNPVYHYGLFSKQPAFIEQATQISESIAACA